MEMRYEAPNREKRRIQSLKLMLPFVWNPHGFHVVDAMPYHAMDKERCSRLHTIPASPKYYHRDRCSARREVKGRERKATFSKSGKRFCDDNFLRIAGHPSHPPCAGRLGISKTAFKDDNSGLQKNFVLESEKFWRKSGLMLWQTPSGNWSIDGTIHCNKWKVRVMKQTMTH
jgi:hypothetical protein